MCVSSRNGGADIAKEEERRESNGSRTCADAFHEHIECSTATGLVFSVNGLLTPIRQSRLDSTITKGSRPRRQHAATSRRCGRHYLVLRIVRSRHLFFRRVSWRSGPKRSIPLHDSR